MIKTINLAENIEERLLAICQQIGREENELIKETILNYLEDLEDSRDAQERLSNRPERYFTLAEVEQKLGLANRICSQSTKRVKKLDGVARSRIIQYLKEQVTVKT